MQSNSEGSWVSGVAALTLPSSASFPIVFTSSCNGKRSMDGTNIRGRKINDFQTASLLLTFPPLFFIPLWLIQSRGSSSSLDLAAVKAGDSV